MPNSFEQQQIEMMKQMGLITKIPFDSSGGLTEILGAMLNVSYFVFLIAIVPFFIFHMRRKEQELLIAKRNDSYKELSPTERKATEDLWRGDIRHAIYSDKQIIRSTIKRAIIDSLKIAAGIFILNTVIIIIAIIVVLPFFVLSKM